MEFLTEQEVIDNYNNNCNVRYISIIGTNTSEEEDMLDIYFSNVVATWLKPLSKDDEDKFRNGKLELNSNQYVEEKDNKLYTYEKIKVRLNKPFFRIGLKDRSDRGIYDTSYKVIDPDYKNWSYKTWIFTNIPMEQHTGYFLDRTNRVGLIAYKDDMPDTLYYALNIPKTAKGIFIVKDTVCARPEFNNKGCQSYGNAKTLIDVAKEGNPLNINRHDDLPRYREDYFPATIQPKDSDKDSSLSLHPLFKEDIWDKRDREAAGLPLQSEYLSLFNPGYDSMWIKRYLQNRKDVDVRRWLSIVNTHYNNYNMDISLDHDVDMKDTYDRYVRDYTGSISNYIYKLPNTREEAELHRIPDDINLDSWTAYRTTGYKPKEKIREGYITHTESSALDVLLKQEPYVLDKYHRFDVKDTIDKMNKRIDKYMLRRNTISFEDIIFIPLEKLIKENYQYYCEETDIMFVLGNTLDPKHVMHPFSRAANNKYLRDESDKLPTEDVVSTISIYNRKDADNNVIYYTKVFGQVIKIPVKKCDKLGKSDYIKIDRNNQPNALDNVEVYRYTEDNLTMLEIYRDRNEAHNHGYDERIYNKRVNEAKFKELDNELKIQEIKLSIEEMKYKKFKEDVEHSIRVNNLSMEEMIFKYRYDSFMKAVEIKNDAYQKAMKYSIDRLKVYEGIHDGYVERYLANLTTKTQAMKYRMSVMNYEEAKMNYVVETGYLIKDLFNLISKVLS